jgi:xylan 1,4-beta-xylosidase
MAGLGTVAAVTIGWTSEEREELIAYARDTWKSVAEMGDRSELPADGLRHLPSGLWEPTLKTTPTDIGCYLWSVLAAERLKIINRDEAECRLRRTLAAVQRLERVHGFFYDKLDPRSGAILTKAPDGSPIRAIASSVDNGWLAAALLMLRNAFPSLRDTAESVFEPMDFAFFYVPYDPADPVNHPGQMHGAYQIESKSFGGFHRILNTEQRIFSYIGIARGQVPVEHYYRIERTLKPGEQPQGQNPVGEVRSYRGVSVFEGHYEYRGMRIVPSWGGSMFEALMVTLFVPEERWAPRSWGVNHPLYVRAQIEHGLAEAGYGYWGFSPACKPEGGYRTYGVDALGSDPLGYTSNNEDIRTPASHAPSKGPFKNGVVTPHASFLALRYAPREAMENLRKLKAHFPIYGDHGFMDSVNVTTGAVADTILMLDQGMIMAAIANALADDAMRKAFVDQQTERVLRPLLSLEEFTAGPAPANVSASSEIIRVDDGLPTRPFPHFWEEMFGSGRANLTLRDSWRQDLRAMKTFTGCQYIRFHAIFDDENGVYRQGPGGEPIYNWSYIDQIYDGLLALGVRPFVELSFMPSALSASPKPHKFWYKPLPNPPRSYEKWARLVEAFAHHLVDRYGAAEIREWYFEVWNEPNIDFWTGVPAQSTYFELYEAAARAIKAVDREFRVGGPATAQAAWVGDLIQHCTHHKIPLDFVSTHVYGNDPPKDVFGHDQPVNRAEMVARAARKVHDEVKASPRPDLPIIWSEYNVTDRNDAEITDSAFMGPWLANNIRLCDGLTTMMSYWTFSDVFEEEGVVKTPFYGGYGLIAAGGIPKAAFNAFALLHRLGDRRLLPDLKDAIVTKRSDETLAIVVWNYCEPRARSDPKVIELQVPHGRTALITTLDEETGSALTAWRRIGSPQFPTRRQQQCLRSAGRLPSAASVRLERGMLRIALPPHAMALVEIKP